MRQTSRLGQLERTARNRVLALRELVVANRPPAPHSWNSAEQRVTSYVLIEAANLWSQYARAYYLSTAMRARSTTGARVTLTLPAPPRSKEDALTVAIHLEDSRLRARSGPWAPRDEPDWQNPVVLRRVVQHLGASNFSAVDAAAGLAPRTMQHLPRMRNYFAHKGFRTARSARGLAKEYGVAGAPHPMMLLYMVPPSLSQPVLLQWLDDLYRIIRATAT